MNQLANRISSKFKWVFEWKQNYSHNIQFWNRKCKTCGNIKQSFVCGSDNRTYSSACRLDYHNCVHNSITKVLCKGFCPCRGESQTACECFEIVKGKCVNVICLFNFVFVFYRCSSWSNWMPTTRFNNHW